MQKTRKGRALGIAGWSLLAVGLLGLLGSALLVLAPGFQIAQSTPFGQSLTVELPAGGHAVYVTPTDDWGSSSCTIDADGREAPLRPDMTQQDLYLPERWDARGSFEIDGPVTATVSCDGPEAASGAQFTVGPVVSFFSVAGSVLLGAAAAVLTIAGVVLLVIHRVRRER